MTTLSKVFAVVTTFAALAFMAFAAVTVVAGPNWRTIAEDDAIEDYSYYQYSQSEGESPTWSATRIGAAPATPQTIPSSPALPKVVVAVRKNIANEQRTKIDELQKQVDPLKREIEHARALKELHAKGIELREEELEQEAVALNKAIYDSADQAIQKSIETQKTRRKGEKRRNDVFRIRNQLEEIRTQTYGVTEQQKLLRDRLVRVNGDINRLKDRIRQLEANGVTAGGAKAGAETADGAKAE